MLIIGIKMDASILSVHSTKYILQAGNDQEKARSERNSHSKNRGGKNLIDNWVLILRKHNVSRASSYFGIGGHTVTRLI